MSSTETKPKPRSQTLRDFHEEDKLGAAYDSALAKRLVPFLRPHMRWLFLSLFMIVAGSAMKVAIPLVLGGLIARAQAGEADAIARSGLLLAAVVVASQAVGFVATYTMQIAGARATTDLRAHIFQVFQRIELRYFDRTPVGRLVTRATNDVDAVNELFASGVLNAVGDLLTLTGIVVMMLKLDVRMSLIAFASLPIVGLIVRFVRTRARQAFREIRVKTARLNAFLNEQVSGMSVVQAYAREAAMAAEFDEVNGEYRDANKRSIFYEAVLDASIEMVGTVCVASLLWWTSIRHLADSAITFALVVTFTQYIRQFFEPVSLLAQRYTMLQSAMAGAERIFKLLDEAPLEKEPTPEVETKAGDADEAIALEDVTFSYKPGVPVLRDISLHVKRGERVALVGATGAGKTTVTALLLRLYEIEKGTVRVLGKDVNSYGRSALRDKFSVVPQDVFLFAGTIATNVAMSAEEPNVARVKEALARVGALELFERRGGIDAKVEERGANFSAGERQLLAFARAIYKDAPLLILDEATASIDSDTESRLQTAVEAVMEGRTSIVIAHRLSTIRAADRIVVFHRGRIVETGSHEALIAKGGVYAKLHRLQFAVQMQEQHAVAPSLPPP